MKKALPWLAGAALAAAAGVITVASPSPDALRAPILVHGWFDPDAASQQTAVTRTLAAAVTDASFTERVEIDDWSAEGNWLVVTIAASAPRSELDSGIELATLRIGDEVFHASERVRDTLRGEKLRIGIDTIGMLAFELPADIAAGEAELRLSSSYLTPRLDDVTAVTIPLGQLPTASSIEITPPEVAS